MYERSAPRPQTRFANSQRRRAHARPVMRGASAVSSHASAFEPTLRAPAPAPFLCARVVMWVCALLLAATADAATLKAKVSPVQKVIELLDDLKANKTACLLTNKTNGKFTYSIFKQTNENEKSEGPTLKTPLRHVLNTSNYYLPGCPGARVSPPCECIMVWGLESWARERRDTSAL